MRSASHKAKPGVHTTQIQSSCGIRCGDVADLHIDMEGPCSMLPQRTAEQSSSTPPYRQVKQNGVPSRTKHKHTVPGQRPGLDCLPLSCIELYPSEQAELEAKEWPNMTCWRCFRFLASDEYERTHVRATQVPVVVSPTRTEQLLACQRCALARS